MDPIETCKSQSMLKSDENGSKRRNDEAGGKTRDQNADPGPVGPWPVHRSRQGLGNAVSCWKDPTWSNRGFLGFSKSSESSFRSEGEHIVKGALCPSK